MKKKLIILGVLLFALSCSNSANFDGAITATATTPPANLGAVDEFSKELKSNGPAPVSGDPTGFIFDLDADGSVDDGFNDDISDGFDGGNILTIATGDTFDAEDDFPDREIDNENQAYMEDVSGDGDADQIVYRATTDAGLKVTRKVYVTPSYDCGEDATACGLSRYLDCFRNPTDDKITIKPLMNSDLGSDGSGEIVGTADDTDGLSETFYFTEKDSGDGDPNVGFVVGFEGAAKTPNVVWDPADTDEVLVDWSTVTLSPDETACFLTYIILGNAFHDNGTDDNPGSKIMRLARDVYAASPRDGILPSEDANIRNFPPALFTVVGEEDSVPADALITVENQETSQSVTVVSDENGAFNAGLDCSDGDIIEISSSGFTAEVTCE